MSTDRHLSSKNNLMIGYQQKFSDFISNLTDAFSGEYNHNNKELEKMRDEIFDISIIPNAGDDKKNLKSDLNTFLKKDTQNAFDSIKEEMADHG